LVLPVTPERQAGMTVSELRDQLTGLIDSGAGDYDVVAFAPGDADAGIMPTTWDVAELFPGLSDPGSVHPGAAVLRLVD
jgi:hypothetical protein